ncbi:hypothetical protein [Paenibacillus sp. Leaf72]|uniref:hypothetical protein n=1 Tax=Paenibacillus sp. Leaf72 TaxID=1736234 RepID=UPI000AD068E2|nr:hypothetical protein [Paenibacillus sp. Leaf72]
MKKSIQKTFLATTLALASFTSFALLAPTTASAAGTTFITLKKGNSTSLFGANSYVVASGTSIVSVSSSGWLTALNTGSATIRGYSSSGVLLSTWFVTVTS